MSTIVEAIDLKKSYGQNELKFEALKGVSLKIKEGESVAIVGKSGSGKTTLMNILALLDRPSSGEVLLDNQNVLNLKRKELNETRNKKFGFVFQQFFMNRQ